MHTNGVMRHGLEVLNYKFAGFLFLNSFQHVINIMDKICYRTLGGCAVLQAKESNVDPKTVRTRRENRKIQRERTESLKIKIQFVYLERKTKKSNGSKFWLFINYKNNNETMVWASFKEKKEKKMGVNLPLPFIITIFKLSILLPSSTFHSTKYNLKKLRVQSIQYLEQQLL